jgi:hypothetical protein
MARKNRRKARPADPPHPEVITPAPRGAPLPYGLLDLDPVVQTDGRRLKCFLRDCHHYLSPPTRGFRGEVCPQHGVRCHRSATFSYADPRRNVLIDGGLLTRIIRHPFKFESHRFGLERSEDAVTLNVMRSLQEAGCLNLVARFVTGLDTEAARAEPTLYLWGLRLSDDTLTPWDLLIAARERFERRLPVKRPKTEPDIGIHLSGHFLILIEAKFCSENPVTYSGQRRSPQSLTKEELLNLYSDLSLRVMDRQKAAEADRLHGQLYRNMVFSEYMAQLDGPRTQAYLGSLTRAGYEGDACEEFARLIRPEFRDRFTHLTWEDLFTLSTLSWRRLSALREYLLLKTANLVQAFQLRI